jgi:ATP-binding cassette subfamily B protein
MEKTNKKQQLSLLEFLKVIWWIIKIYFKISPLNLIIVIITSAVMQIKGLIYAFLFGMVIDTVVKISQMPTPDNTLLIRYLIILAFYGIFFDGIMATMGRAAKRTLRLLARSEMDRIMFEHLHTLGIQTLEDPEVNNLIQRAQQSINDTFSMLEEIINLISQTVTAITSGIIVYSFLPLMIPVLLLFSIIEFFPDRYFTARDFRWNVRNTEGRRKAFNYASWISTSSNLQEISIIGAYEFFAKKYIDFFDKYNKGVKDIIIQRQIANFFLTILNTGASLYGYALVFIQFINHQITIGTLSFQLKALDSFGNSMTDVLSELAAINEYAVKMSDVVKLFKLKPSFSDGQNPMPLLKEAPEIEFKDVTFAYAGGNKVVIDKLNLKIKSGEKVAIVGHNGAGKTTLVKLLSKMYIPQSGEILVNGQSIADFKTEDWYQNLGTLFQDFNFYGAMTARENIYVGDSNNPLDENRLIEASTNADAHSFISDFPNNYDQVLSERFEGGIRPSSGQAQKIAIARFFYRNTPIVIFDEPTAAIDAVSEYNIYHNFASFFYSEKC